MIAGLGRWFYDWGGVVFGLGSVVSVVAWAIAMFSMINRIGKPPKGPR